MFHAGEMDECSKYKTLLNMYEIVFNILNNNIVLVHTLLALINQLYHPTIVFLESLPENNEGSWMWCLEEI